METETIQERTSFEASSLSEDREEIPETFPGHEALPSVSIYNIQIYILLNIKSIFYFRIGYQ